jgi:hypothetical protein
VLSPQLARDRAQQSRGDSNRHVSLSESNSQTTEFGNQNLLEQLEAENTQLDAVWWSWCSSFKHCAMVPNSAS